MNIWANIYICIVYIILYIHNILASACIPLYVPIDPYTPFRPLNEPFHIQIGKANSLNTTATLFHVSCSFHSIFHYWADTILKPYVIPMYQLLKGPRVSISRENLGVAQVVLSTVNLSPRNPKP